MAKKGLQEYSVLVQLTWRGLRKKMEHMTNEIGVCKEQTNRGKVRVCKNSETALTYSLSQDSLQIRKSQKRRPTVRKAKLCSSAKGLARREGIRVSASVPSSSSRCLHQLLTH